MSRLQQLEVMLRNQPDDPFLRYAIALEHKKAGRLDEALAWLQRTLEADARYCYAYYQQGQVFQSRHDVESARAAYRRGLEAAGMAQDAHAAGEIQAALDALE